MRITEVCEIIRSPTSTDMFKASNRALVLPHANRSQPHQYFPVRLIAQTRTRTFHRKHKLHWQASQFSENRFIRSTTWPAAHMNNACSSSRRKTKCYQQWGKARFYNVTGHHNHRKPTSCKHMRTCLIFCLSMFSMRCLALTNSVSAACTLLCSS